MVLGTGTKLGRYEIRAKTGEGGMGEVYLAQDTKLDRKVALKTLPPDVASNRDRMGRFVREAKAAAALNHPNIAHIYEISESDVVHFRQYFESAARHCAFSRSALEKSCGDCPAWGARFIREREERLFLLGCLGNISSRSFGIRAGESKRQVLSRAHHESSEPVWNVLETKFEVVFYSTPGVYCAIRETFSAA